MLTYQLRLPVSRRLDDWLDEVSWAVWSELVHHPALEPLGPHAFVRIREILHDLFESRVTTYRSCGLWSYCRAGTSPSPWTLQETYRPDAEDVQWFLLEVPYGLEGLAEEAADRIGEFLACFLSGLLPRSVMEATVETALRRGIGRYLYENHHCGAHPFCAGRVPLNPWQPPSKTVVGGSYA